jgi:hypothetical protein
MDIGNRRDLSIGGASPLGTGTAKPLTPAAPPLDVGPPVVGTYVIETSDLRFELKDRVPLGDTDNHRKARFDAITAARRRQLVTKEPSMGSHGVDHAHLLLESR